METTELLSDYQLERGKPMPNILHGAIQANLVFELKSHYRQSYRVVSEVSLATVPDGATPDVLLYPSFPLDYLNALPAKRSDAPLLCIDIQSPSQSLEEMIEKVARYFAFGVKSCWVVVPSLQAVLVYDQPGHYQFFHGNDTLRDAGTGIELPLPGIFA
ncbi:MAG: Uma2 family endonuclease [Ferruginibacter sp.]|nr:Uma2 family endonuclease [Cytophagales bacterium]